MPDMIPAQNQRQVDLRRGYIDALNSLQTGTYKGSGDIIDYTLYDRLTIDQNRSVHHLFQVGVGQNDPLGNVKTLADTNVQGSQGIPVGQKLYVNAIKVMLTSTTIPITAQILGDFQQMIEDTTLTVRITGKDNYGLWKLNEMFGVPFQAAISEANQSTPTSHGRYLGIYPLNLPIVLAQQVQFEVTIEHHAGTAASLDNSLMSVGLSGILERLS